MDAQKLGGQLETAVRIEKFQGAGLQVQLDIGGKRVEFMLLFQEQWMD
ncbi:hypothetical protein ACFQDL_09160 [Marinobacterium aestuariivivens]|uniref:Uncharacterized protein n=1 Tax=Marinobacterium aestuariivivens TaxID=1698799 RepID=A0ABW1ZYH4_9GAMM